MATYITKRPTGLTRSIVVRTEESLQRASNRVVLRTPSKPLTGDPQDNAREKFLSRSKPYFDKGKAEAARRFTREQNRLLRMEAASLNACRDFDAEKITQEAEAA